jgi:hypothetical protein
MNTVSVRVSYRPLRLGMCIAVDSLEDLRRAVRLNSTLWGGKFNPIIPIGGDIAFPLQLVRTFKVDALFAVSDAAEVRQFIDGVKFLPWPDVHRQLFISGAGGPLPVFLDVYHPLRNISQERAKHGMPALDGGMLLRDDLTRLRTADNPLYDALLCEFGDYPVGDECPIDYGAVAQRMSERSFCLSNPDGVSLQITGNVEHPSLLPSMACSYTSAMAVGTVQACSWEILHCSPIWLRSGTCELLISACCSYPKPDKNRR